MSQNILKRGIKILLKKMPYCGKIIREREQMAHLPGHFYSPYPLIEDIKLKEKEIFESFSNEIPSIERNESKQLILLNEFVKYYQEIPFDNKDKMDKLRYFSKKSIDNNNSYGYSDGLILYSMIRHLQPKKIIEVGSGYSSCMTLDTNELFFNNSISCTFIEPYPQKLFSLIKENDLNKIEVISKKLQDIPLSKFSSLSAGDILFIDSTHVSKVNSDVNYIFFEILPYLNQGVYIHFHDIFYPFEYPKRFIYTGVAWNEDYMLRAFLQYNNAFSIIFYNNFLFRFHEEKFKKGIPLIKKRGSSCWIKKL